MLYPLSYGGWVVNGVWLLGSTGDGEGKLAPA
jgi:hypothetical protein